MLATVLAPALRGGKHEAVAHVGHFPGPAPVQVGLALAAAEAFDDAFHLEEFRLGVLHILGAGQGALGAGPQLALEIPDFGIRAGLRFQFDIAAGVVVDLAQGLVDPLDALLDGLALAGELRLEIGHLSDGVLVEQFLEARLEAGQIVGLQLVEHGAVFAGRVDRDIHFLGLQRIRGAVGAHGVDDPVAQPLDAAVLGVDPGLEPVAQVPLTVVAGFDGERLLVQRFAAQGFQLRKT